MSDIWLPLSFFVPLLILSWIAKKWPPKTLDELIEEDKRASPEKM